ncbi:MAG: dihydrolipoyl dehydrogenase [Streptococcaceae bacterium]|jgi:dihydrolipoamide dehydrogenase|nr:dihydrolipoyl dehydrogenase [Streptococcaceae bacterium]
MVVGNFAQEKDTLVIGSGPGGYVAAIRAAQMGRKVTIIEGTFIGGVCLNVGCIPSKALINAGHRYEEAQHGEMFGVKTENVILDFATTQLWKDTKVVGVLTKGVEMLLKKNKVEIIRGWAEFVDNKTVRVIDGDESQLLSFENMIVATGSRPIEIPGFKFENRVVDSTGALNLPEVPKHLVVIGGGYIGCELAGAYANLGAKVTILEGMDKILPNFDDDMVKLVTNNFAKKNVDIVTSAMAKGSEQTADGVKVSYEVGGKIETIEADYVLVSVGRRPNTDTVGLNNTDVKLNSRNQIIVNKQGMTNVEGIYAIGDIVPGLTLAHKASYEAKIAAEAIGGQKVEINYQAIPAVCFTDPELATAGMLAHEAKEAGYEIKSTTFPFAGNGRALSLGKTEGFVRLITEKSSDVILGAQVAGVGASDLIGELTLAIESGMSTEDIALTIHAHPSLGEIIMDASEAGLGMPIHM